MRIAFSGRAGGVSEGAYSSLNVGGHVGDAAQAVQENRRRLAEALGAGGLPLVVPKQVHGTALVDVTVRTGGMRMEFDELLHVLAAQRTVVDVRRGI